MSSAEAGGREGEEPQKQQCELLRQIRLRRERKSISSSNVGCCCRGEKEEEEEQH